MKLSKKNTRYQLSASLGLEQLRKQAYQVLHKLHSFLINLFFPKKSSAPFCSGPTMFTLFVNFSLFSFFRETMQQVHNKLTI